MDELLSLDIPESYFLQPIDEHNLESLLSEPSSPTQIFFNFQNSPSSSDEQINSASPNSDPNSESSVNSDAQTYTNDSNVPDSSQLHSDGVGGVEILLEQKKRIQLSEKSRRDRLNEKIMVLQQILPYDSKSGSKGKKRTRTKEQILEDTIQYVRQLQTEVKKTKLVQPVVRLSTPQQELITYYKNLVSQFGLFTNHSESLLTYYRIITDLSEKIDDPDYKMYTCLISSMYYRSTTPDPVMQLQYQKQGIDMYFEKQKKQPTTEPIVVDFADIGVTLMIECASTLASIGYVDAAKKQMAETAEWAKKLGHEESLLTYKCKAWSDMYWVGEKLSIMEAQQIFKELENLNHIYSAMAETCFGYTLVECSNARSDQLAGMSLVEKSPGKMVCGSSVDLFRAPLVLGAYLILQEYEKGIQRADKILQQMEATGFEGSFTSADVLRLKAELMVLKLKKTQDYSIMDKIEEAFLQSRQKAILYKLKAIELKCVCSMLKFFMETNQTDKVEQWKEELQLLLNFYSENTKTYVPPDVTKATALFENLKL